MYGSGTKHTVVISKKPLKEYRSEYDPEAIKKIRISLRSEVLHKIREVLGITSDFNNYQLYNFIKIFKKDTYDNNTHTKKEDSWNIYGRYIFNLISKDKLKYYLKLTT